MKRDITSYIKIFGITQLLLLIFSAYEANNYVNFNEYGGGPGIIFFFGNVVIVLIFVTVINLLTSALALFLGQKVSQSSSNIFLSLTSLLGSISLYSLLKLVIEMPFISL